MVVRVWAHYVEKIRTVYGRLISLKGAFGKMVLKIKKKKLLTFRL